jgi:hypothetical protein
MQPRVGPRLETADKRGESLNHIPIPERAVPQGALHNAFRQILEQKGMGIEEIVLD